MLFFVKCVLSLSSLSPFSRSVKLELRFWSVHWRCLCLAQLSQFSLSVFSSHRLRRDSYLTCTVFPFAFDCALCTEMCSSQVFVRVCWLFVDGTLWGEWWWWWWRLLCCVGCRVLPVYSSQQQHCSAMTVNDWRPLGTISVPRTTAKSFIYLISSQQVLRR